jgi:hypothetical protein
LVQGNKWSYTSASSGNPILIVNGQNVLGGKNYVNISDQTQKLYSVDIPLREDPVTGDIFSYNTSTDKEYLEVPGSPTIDQTWARAGTVTRKVTNLSASLTTSKCTYTGLLEVTVFDNGVAGSKYYYKRGLGPVAILGFKLTAVTLN